jgi:hypothetical protein
VVVDQGRVGAAQLGPDDAQCAASGAAEDGVHVILPARGESHAVSWATNSRQVGWGPAKSWPSIGWGHEVDKFAASGTLSF